MSIPKLEYNGARPLNVLGYEHQKPPEWISIPTDADPDAQALVEPDTARVLATIDTQINGLYAVEVLDRGREHKLFRVSSPETT
jgi:hypothetical protein